MLVTFFRYFLAPLIIAAILVLRYAVEVSWLWASSPAWIALLLLVGFIIMMIGVIAYVGYHPPDLYDPY